MPDRAQSETVGAVLLVGLVTITAGVAGTYAMGAVTTTTDDPRADITGTIRTDGITLSHQGGARLPGEELRLVVRVNGSETPRSWSDGTLSGGDGVFDPGEGWSVGGSYDAESVVAVRLIHHPSDTVVFRAERTPTSVESVESDTGGYVEAVDSEGEIEPGDVSTPSTPDESAPDPGQLIRARDPGAGARTTHVVNYSIARDSATAGNSLGSVVIEYPDGSADVTGVDERRDVRLVGIDEDRDGTIDVDATDDIECCPPGDGVITPDENTLRIEFSGNYNLEGGDALVIEYEDVRNPSAGEYPVTVTVNGEVSDTGTLEIDPSGDDDEDEGDEDDDEDEGDEDDDEDEGDEDDDEDAAPGNSGSAPGNSGSAPGQRGR
jgi:hypothetical protein